MTAQSDRSIDPKQLRLFRNKLPKKPYCSDDLDNGLLIRSIPYALGKRYIQYNPPNSIIWMVFDLDRMTCIDEIVGDLGLPAPHIFVQNQEANERFGFAHAYYCLHTPVHNNYNSNPAPLRLAGAVDSAFSVALNADASFSGLIAKNPVHDHWYTYTTPNAPYELGELSEFVTLDKAANDRRHRLPDIGCARNFNLFEALRKWAYRNRYRFTDYGAWHKEVANKANGYNHQLETDGKGPLWDREVGYIAKSVSKWTWRNLSTKEFSAIQSCRGSNKGRRTREQYLAAALRLRGQGATQEQIAGELGVTQQTIGNWLNRYDSANFSLTSK